MEKIQPSTRFLALICLAASLGGVLFGFDTAVISGTFGLVEAHFTLNKIEVGWFASSALVGAIFGAAVAGILGDRFGRKVSLILAALLFLISAFGSMLPPDFFFLISARLVGGLGVGLASVLAPLYISEVAPPQVRGRLVALYQLSIVVGILLAYFSNWILQTFAQTSAGFGGSTLLHQIMIGETWRAMFGAEIIPSAIFLISLCFVPESPRWLIKNDHSTRGFKVLAKISGIQTAKDQLAAIHLSLSQVTGKMAELLKPGLRLALMVGVGLSVFGQFTGVNIIIYYGPTILEDAGFGLDSALQFQVAIGIINLIFTLIAIWKIDQWGRRPLLIWGMTSVFISLLIIAIQFTMTKAAGLWIVIMLCVYMASLAISINAVIWVLIGEIFPNRLRGRAMSIATFANWATNFLTAFLFPWYVEKIGLGAGFFTFAAMCLLATMFFYKYVPETKGKSLEEIERNWNR